MFQPTIIQGSQTSMRQARFSDHRYGAQLLPVKMEHIEKNGVVCYFAGYVNNKPHFAWGVVISWDERQCLFHSNILVNEANGKATIGTFGTTMARSWGFIEAVYNVERFAEKAVAA